MKLPFSHPAVPLPVQEKLQAFGQWGYFLYRSFQRDQLLLRASALTYTTALSIVPFLAVAFSITKGLGFQNTEYMQEILLRLSAGREQVVSHIIDYINRTNVATLGSMGVGLLLFTVFTLIGTIEKSFNTIWGVQSQRSLTRKFSDYLSVTLVCPLLIIVATSFTASMQSSSLVQYILSYTLFSTVYILILKIMPFLLVSLALFFMYFFITNTRIGLGSTLVGAICAGSLWQASQQTFIHYQIGVSKYNAIYGSFAQLPLFLFWLYISWVIVLLGAEISFCLSNSGASKDENQLGEFNLDDKERLGLAVVVYLISRLQSQDESCSPRELAKALNMPVKPVNRVLTALESLGLVAVVAGNNEERLVLIGCPQRMKVEEFLRIFRRFRETGDLTFSGSDGLEKFCAQRREAMESGELNMTLEELSIRIFGARS
ncbi:YhjD/YihY/BrkB family envelope integrity protein [Desulfovermiculus halophilus]|jgi:membrane protein|uniref:YhjD/YihY/BrkB family envelope integrity protein n=1 Tax=Desulfovermiculus halophilus TaxID=339722 RepID=UPI0006874B76|nr:YhjD/YihY/BrkB family envelope integrity protein [Desulfovermiculus halophilus]